jgi:hypothetical protein
MRFARLVLPVVGLAVSSLPVLAAPPEHDPIERWANAVGGRDRVAQVHAIYREATIRVAGGEGTIKAWHTADGRYRKEERGGNFARVETFDGTTALVQVGAAPARELTGAERERAISQAFANTNAVFFAFFPDRRRGRVSVEPDGTIVLQPEGGIDWRVELGAVTALPSRMMHAEGERTVVVDFVSYDTVEGLTLESAIRRSPGDPRFDAEIRFTHTVLNPPIEDALFAIASTPAPVGVAVAPTITGHWEGAIHAAANDFTVAVDLARDDAGQLVGTFSNAAQRINGLPLWSASVDGRLVKLEIKSAGPAIQTFDGRLSPDGRTITGQFLVDVYAMPFELERTGAARIAAPPRSAAVDAKLAGSWAGTLELAGQALPLALTLTNHPDQTATGAWAAGGAPLSAVSIAVDGRNVSLTSAVTPTTFTGTVNEAGTELSGTLTERGVGRPVVFARAAE